MIRMKNEKHGFTYAENSMQEAYLRGLGWICEHEEFDSDHTSMGKKSIGESCQALESPKRGRSKRIEYVNNGRNQQDVEKI